MIKYYFTIIWIMPQLVFRNLPSMIKEDDIKKHVISPNHTRGVVLQTVDESKEKSFKITVVRRPFPRIPHLDLEGFGKEINSVMKDIVSGYVLQIRQHGQVVHTGIWNWAQTPADKSLGWNENAKMHLASVSKFLTAVGLVKCLIKKGISYDAKIIDYLPSHWIKGANINKISFRHLLTHRSGFITGGSGTDYTLMKDKVAAGVSDVGGASHYENMNYGLCRILIPIINGDVAKEAVFVNVPEYNEISWDFVTLSYYVGFMSNNVFIPAGVFSADYKPTSNPLQPNALAYPGPANGIKGWDSGNLRTVLGGAGWRLSTNELLNVMDHMRRKNTIIDKTVAQYMLDHYFGIDRIDDTPAGKIYNKNGGWGSGGKKEQCVAYFLPNDMELALFVNSPIGNPEFSLRNLVRDLYKKHLIV